MTEMLKPCPFCGGKADIVFGSDTYCVMCLNDGCYAQMGEDYDRSAMPNYRFNSPEEATAAWNRRSPPASSDALVRALEATLALARIKWGNLDEDANTVFAQADEALTAHRASLSGGSNGR